MFLIRKPNSVNDFKRPVCSLSVAFFYFPFTLNHNTILCYKTNNARFNELDRYLTQIKRKISAENKVTKVVVQLVLLQIKVKKIYLWIKFHT